VLSGIDHPIIQKIARQGRLLDLLSKYLTPWGESVKLNNGVLRYKLHQCRGDEHGTVRGRYSASMPDGGSTPHQVMKPSRQRKSMGAKYILRELVIPGQDDGLLVSADAMQIEYRIFASYTKSKKLRDAYAANPMLQFHEETRRMIEEFKPGIDYDGSKTLNFLSSATLREPSSPNSIANFLWTQASASGVRLQTIRCSSRLSLSKRRTTARYLKRSHLQNKRLT